MFDFNDCFVNEALAPESSMTLTREGLEFDCNFKKLKTTGFRLEVDIVGLERLQKKVI
jgi:hypothetical protein